MATAVDYVNNLGMDNIAGHEANLLKYARQQLSQIENLTVYGKAKENAGCVSFTLNNIHHYDVGMIIDKLGVAVRTGTHCAQPLMDKFGITGTIRASFGLYNTKEEVTALIEAIKKVKVMFGE